MTTVAIRRQSREVVVGMARRAGDSGVRPGQRERSVVVIERRAGPVGGAVARGAGRRESRSGVIRAGGPGVIRLVTRVAIRGKAGEVAVDVARRARDRSM